MWFKSNFQNSKTPNMHRVRELESATSFAFYGYYPGHIWINEKPKKRGWKWGRDEERGVRGLSLNLFKKYYHA